MASDSATRRDRRTAVALGGVGVASLVLLQLRDPHASGSYGLCPFHALTGWWCPLCGGLRATHDLFALRIGDALSANVFAVVLVLAGVGYFGYWASIRWRGRPARTLHIGARGLVTVLAVAAAFTVVRNVEFGAALAP
ncbi:DUF2752 domain-containing protein [Solicola gregarius]|uniref:DUF2752 domain-containing protein n=1 Tax=Solicola gregarius TaxID=2908642 RepID=A0AA46YL75_9ACTN|nr:DUF2752 domain-containing protein [Solicola gregarius]UYM05324.1 DUF2752 domain-containing protein [Solicola gregarius]